MRLDGVSGAVSHGRVRRFAAAALATNLALAFLALCLASCLAPADAHGCCRSKSPMISAQTNGCCLDTDGVSVAAAANDLPADTSVGEVVHSVLTSKSAAPFGAPATSASPPRVLRI
jgi:hypothetical protein